MSECMCNYRKARLEACANELATKDAEIAKLTRKLEYKQAECDRARAATQVVEDRWRKRMEVQKNG